VSPDEIPVIFLNKVIKVNPSKTKPRTENQRQTVNPLIVLHSLIDHGANPVPSYSLRSKISVGDLV
jgi:hypothetical protein